MPSLEGGVGWINSGPIDLRQLKGKIVLLDFWTYCCINCHHVLPDLAKLEEKYTNELVVIGVHSAKFDAEKDTENIRRKVAEYRIKHPVVNDADQVIWDRFGVESWPTLVLIDPDGELRRLGQRRGALRPCSTGSIGKLVAERKAKDELERDAAQVLRPRPRSRDDTPAALPRQGPGRRGRASGCSSPTPATTGSSSTDLEGKSPVAIGTGGDGLVDGAFDKAELQPARRGCAWSATRSTSPTPRTTPSAPST